MRSSYNTAHLHFHSWVKDYVVFDAGYSDVGFISSSQQGCSTLSVQIGAKLKKTCSPTEIDHINTYSCVKWSLEPIIIVSQDYQRVSTALETATAGFSSDTKTGFKQLKNSQKAIYNSIFCLDPMATATECAVRSVRSKMQNMWSNDNWKRNADVKDGPLPISHNIALMTRDVELFFKIRPHPEVQWAYPSATGQF